MQSSPNRVRLARRTAVFAVLAAAAFAAPMPSARSGGGPGPLATDAPRRIYDAVAHAPLSSVAGETVYVIRGDLNGDHFPDVVNVTARGAQVFLNQGTTAGVFSMGLAQEIPFLHSYGGGAFDVDGDLDLDLVMGDVDHVLIALNDGTGQFALTRPVRHGFSMPTVAVPFLSKTGGRLRIALCAAADNVAGDLIAPNPMKLPFLYVLESDGEGGFPLLQKLDRMNCGGVAAGDWDGDGDTDLAASSRSYLEPPEPTFLYRSDDAAGMPGFTGIGAPGAGEIGNYFAYRPHVTASGDLLFGAWHHQSFLRRSGPTWDPAVNVQFDAGFGTGESWANDTADMDCDGADDLVAAGRFTPVHLARLATDPNDPAERFTAPHHGGTSTDLSATDWDRDEFLVPDVVVGGSDGLFILRNVNGGEAHTPGWSPLRPSHEPLLEAYQKITELLDPTRVPPLETIEARFYAALCQTYLDFMHPAYLTDGTLSGMTNAEKVAFLQSTDDTVHLCDYYLYIAKLWAAGEPEDVATIVEIRGLLTESSISLLDEAIGLGGSLVPLAPNPAKTRSAAGTAKSAQKLFRSVLADRDFARQAAARSRMETDPARQERWQRLAIQYTTRAGDRLARVWNLLGY